MYSVFERNSILTFDQFHRIVDVLDSISAGQDGSIDYDRMENVPDNDSIGIAYGLGKRFSRRR